MLLVGCSSTASTRSTDTSAAEPSATDVSAAATSTLAGDQAPSAGDTCDGAPALDIAYTAIDGVDPNLLSLDVYPVPGECDAPVVIWIHGGGWRIGDKSNLARQRADFYNSHGWLLVAVNYRLTTAEADPPVVFPDHNNDAAAALGWVNLNVAAHGGDPDRVMLTGHSAGGSIAASFVADPSYLAAHDLDPSWLNCAVLLDTAGYDITTAAQSSGSSDIYLPAFGTDPDVWVAASPISHVGEGPLPAHVLVVTRGQQTRITEAHDFTDALMTSGVDATVANVNPLTHAEVNSQIGVNGSVMTPLLLQALERCSAE